MKLKNVCCGRLLGKPPGYIITRRKWLDNFSYLAKDGKFIKDENLFKICKKTFAPVCSIRGNNDQFSFLS
jgi:hypothetical protein